MKTNKTQLKSYSESGRISMGGITMNPIITGLNIINTTGIDISIIGLNFLHFSMIFNETNGNFDRYSKLLYS